MVSVVTVRFPSHSLMLTELPTPGPERSPGRETRRNGSGRPLVRQKSGYLGLGCPALCLACIEPCTQVANRGLAIVKKPLQG